MRLQWTTKLAELDILSDKEEKALSSAGMLSVSDVLMRMPKRHEDRRCKEPISEMGVNQSQCYRVKVLSCGWKFSYKRYFEAVVIDAEAGEGLVQGMRLHLRWFHMPYIAKLLAQGQTLFIYGNMKVYGGQLCMMNPEFEELEDDAGLRLAQRALGGSWEGATDIPAADTPDHISIHTDRLVPVYRSVSGVQARRFRDIIWALLRDLDPQVKPPYYDLAPQYSWYEALHDMHFPSDMSLVHKARLRFALSECFLQQFRVQWKRRRSQLQTGQITCTSRYYLDELEQSLPFTMTDAQQRCLQEIMADMRKPIPMNRLVQGDVGSGKTLVALAAMLLAVESGKVAAMIAPTQILAEQHFSNFSRLLKGMDIRISLRTSDKREDSDLIGLESKSDDDTPRIVVGTHALLYAKNKVKKLGLAVIDEQHKFGVEQRQRFLDTEEIPDLLVMTATPIPRTLTLTLYGDLDVSIIDELPANRGEIVTALRHPKRMKRIISFLRDQLAEGRQVYIVSPLLETSETRKQSSVLEELERWKEEFPDYEVGLLHGKLSPIEKEEAMHRFRDNETQILVATTVVEVGVDVANATVMMINDADSFGLSQLHQLRGRIGRGEHKSYCILLSTADANTPAREKLDILVASSDGFVIAEQDFRLRGPGEVLGTAQSGLGSVQFPEWLSHSRLIHRAMQDALRILDSDPELSAPEHQLLRELVSHDSEEAVMA